MTGEESDTLKANLPNKAIAHALVDGLTASLGGGNENADAVAFLQSIVKDENLGQFITGTEGSGEYANQNQTWFTASGEQYDNDLINLQTLRQFPEVAQYFDNIQTDTNVTILTLGAQEQEMHADTLSPVERLEVAELIMQSYYALDSGEMPNGDEPGALLDWALNQPLNDARSALIGPAIKTLTNLRLEERDKLSPEQQERVDALYGQIQGQLIASAIGGGGGSGAKIKPQTPQTKQPVTTGKTVDTSGGIANKTVKVDISKAEKGTPEYEALNNPKPNTTTELSNGTTFKTGRGGFVEEVTYQPVDSSSVRDSRQTAVGKEGIAGDVGGHIQACRHGGTCDRFNLFPQNSNFNNSAYKRWENEITKALQNGDDVGNVKVKLNRADPFNPRPDSLEIEYQINGETRILDFRNEAGG